MKSLPLSALRMADRMITCPFRPSVISIAILALSTFSMILLSSLNQYSAFATFPGENGKIAFVSNRDGNLEIYVMNADGTEQQNISNNPAHDSYPSWSPDGTKIAFTRTFFTEGEEGTEDNYEIYVMNADGTGQTRLTNDPSDDIGPVWSPDGTKIAFSRSSDDANADIFVMDAEDGSNPIRLTSDPNNVEVDGDPSWSPDGTKIAFSSSRGSDSYDIFVMNAEDGTQVLRLTTDTRADEAPDWSPDGTKIVFERSIEGLNYEIYVMNAEDGSGQTRLTNDPSYDSQSSWSPDGTKIAFSSNRNNNWDIYVMNAEDGSGQTRLTNNAALDRYPDWATATDTEPEDTTPPILTVPEDIVINATSEQGAEVTYNVTAKDNVDGTAILEEDNTTTQDDIGGNITISCDPASGSEFLIGETEVECIAIDEAGNEGTASFTVTVNPSSPPPPPPDPLTVEINSNATQGMEPATFEFEAIVTGGTAPYTYNWDFGDGSSSEVSQQQQTVIHTYEDAGVYAVTLIVTDSDEQQQQEATDTLQITVTERPLPPPPPPTTPREAIERLISHIENLEDVPENAKTRLTLILERALTLLTDNNARNDASACNMLGTEFINQVDASERQDTLAEDQAADVRTQAEDIRDMFDC